MDRREVYALPLIRIAIIDDDPVDTAGIEELLLRAAGTDEVRIDHFSSAEFFLNSAASNCYHAAIMDIYLKGMDGIEASGRLEGLCDRTLVVFITSSREDVWRAVQTHRCFDYIRKDELQDAHTMERFDQLFAGIRKMTGQAGELVEFYAGKRLVRIRAADITYVIAQDKYIVIQTRDGQDRRYRTTFRTICKELEGNSSFLECNRGILLNMNQIRATDGETFEMKTGGKFPIRRSDRRKIIDSFRSYQFEQLNNISVYE